MRPGERKKAGDKTEGGGVVVVMGRETGRPQSEKAAAACDWQTG